MKSCPVVIKTTNIYLKSIGGNTKFAGANGRLEDLKTIAPLCGPGNGLQTEARIIRRKHGWNILRLSCLSGSQASPYSNLRNMGVGQNYINHQGTTGCSPWFHLPGLNFG